MIDIASRVLSRLQERKRGQTIEELQDYLEEPQSKILTVLLPLRLEGHVALSESGVWYMIREED